MLLLVNGFLIFAYASTAWRDGQNAERIRHDTYAALTRLGITLDEALLPERVSGLKPYRANVNTVSDEASMRAILGECTVENQGGGKRIYHGKEGEATLRGSEISLKINRSIRTENEARSFATATLKTLGCKTDTMELVAPAPDCVIETVGTLLNVPVFNARLKFVFGEKIVTVTGTRLLYTLEATTGTVRDASELLLKLGAYWDARGAAKQTITGIIPGYLSEDAPNGGVSLTPGWEVRTDKGSWYLNAQTGDVVTLQ